MKVYLRPYAYRERVKEFLLKVDAEVHLRNIGHKLFTTNEIEMHASPKKNVNKETYNKKEVDAAEVRCYNVMLGIKKDVRPLMPRVENRKCILESSAPSLLKVLAHLSGRYC